MPDEPAAPAPVLAAAAPSPEPPPITRFASFGAAGGATAFGVVACYAGMIFQGMVLKVAPGAPVSLLSLAAGLLLALSLSGKNALGRGLGPRGAAVRALAVAAVAPTYAVLAHLALALPLTQASAASDGPARFGWLAVLVVLTAGLSVVAGGVIAAPFLRRESARRAALVRVSALAAVALLGALVAAGAARRARLPALDRYLASLPVAGELPALAGPAPGRAPQVDVMELAALTLRRACHGDRCTATLTPRGEAQEWPPFGLRTSDALAVRRDAARDLWLADAASGHLGPFYDRTIELPGVVAFHGPALEVVPLLPSAVAASVGPPRGWLVGGALGLALSAVPLARRRRARRELAEIEAAQEGALGEDGWIALGDGSPPVRAPAGEAVAPGPVLVVLEGLAGRGAYRRSASPAVARIRGGGRAELVLAVRARMLAHDARALAAAAVLGAPLAAAWLHGLLG